MAYRAASHEISAREIEVYDENSLPVREGLNNIIQLQAYMYTVVFLEQTRSFYGFSSAN